MLKTIIFELKKWVYSMYSVQGMFDMPHERILNFKNKNLDYEKE